MLATIAALHIAVLSQTPAPNEIRPEEAVRSDAAVEESHAPPPELAQTSEDAPAPEAPAQPDEGKKPEEPERTEPSLPERPAALIPPSPPPGERQVSLLSAEPLGGTSATIGWLGWSSLGVMYGQGITARDDLGAFLDFDWSKTELRLGGFYRRPLGMAGPFPIAARLAVAWYANFGGHWIHRENHSDRGVEFTPGLSLSKRGAGGIFSGIVDAPITVTTRGGAGLLFSPRLTGAYEALLYQDVTVGARIGVGARAGSGDAPLAETRTELTFLLVATYQVL